MVFTREKKMIRPIRIANDALTREIFFEEKLRISARPCNIFY